MKQLVRTTTNKKAKQKQKNNYVSCLDLGRGSLFSCFRVVFAFLWNLDKTPQKNKNKTMSAVLTGGGVVCCFFPSRVVFHSLEQCGNPEKTNKNTKQISISCPDLGGYSMFCFGCLKFFLHRTVSGQFARASVIKCAGVLHQSLVQ